MPADSLTVLLAGLVDYAGLFPPASLTMAEVVANYASYRQSSDSWALGRLIVPVARLGELAGAIAPIDPTARAKWRVSALAGNDAPNDARQIFEWNASANGAVVDSVELRATSPDVVSDVAQSFGDLPMFVEVSLGDDTPRWLDAIARAGVRAKMRTGGVTADAFPTSARIVAFLRGCADRDVAFKATAGLHHPLRDTYPLTYASSAPRGEMFGFLNVFLAAAFARQGLPERELLQQIEERDPSSLVFTSDAIHWRDEEIDIQRLADIRTSFAIAFGSCSFREPIDDLHRLGLL